MLKDKDVKELKSSETKQLLDSLKPVLSEDGEYMHLMEVADMKRSDEDHDSAKSELTKILAFKCPKCGGNRLQWDRLTPYYRSAIVRAIEVDAEGNSSGVEAGCYIGLETLVFPRRLHHRVTGAVGVASTVIMLLLTKKANQLRMNGRWSSGCCLTARSLKTSPN